MSKTMFADVPPEDRLRLLIDNCDSREETNYMKDLGQEELDVKRETLTANYIQINDFDEELTAIKAGFKEKTEPLKLQNKSLLTQIKTRKEEVKGIIFNFADHEGGMMNTYDEQGELISSRRLRPEEKQAKLFIAHGKTGTGE